MYNVAKIVQVCHETEKMSISHFLQGHFNIPLFHEQWIIFHNACIRFFCLKSDYHTGNNEVAQQLKVAVKYLNM